jgi:predicted Rossmann fold flavoprotein
MKDIQVSDLVMKDKKIIGIKLKDSKTEIGFRNIIIATGGLSYPYSGSSGDGLRWAKKAGQGVTAQKPALTPVRLEERWVGELEGLSLKNVRISVYRDNKKQDERFGEAIFTDDGMSGPIVLDMSKKIGELISGGRVKFFIDYKPALTFAELDLRVQKDFIENQNRMFKNSLDELLPQKLIPVIVGLSGIDAEKKVNLVTKEERNRLVHLLKEMEVNVRGLVGFDKAVITSGGVSLREIDPKTMKSKLVDNLYFAGEVLDLDAPTGGYNLQEAWSTGHLAGKSAGEQATHSL